MGLLLKKLKAERFFEKIVRDGIDPRLLEWTKRNNFKTRIFPIPAKGIRTVKIKYVTT